MASVTWLLFSLSFWIWWAYFRFFWKL